MAGTGPVVVLLHGTGAATHSWRDVLPLLASRYTVIAPDLPGHGFTGSPGTEAGFALPGVARSVAGLLRTLAVAPALLVGHSAGAAIAIRMCLDGLVNPVAVISLNGALMPFPGMTNQIFGPAARLLAGSRFAAQAVTLFAGSRPSVERLLRATGSRIDAEGAKYYARMVAHADHVHGALALMANWDLKPLVADLPHLKQQLVLVTGSRDGMVPPNDALRVRALRPQTEVITLRGLGHLAHEEKPEEVVRMVERVLPAVRA
jgi:magnesium chelatase accessory protein